MMDFVGPRVFLRFLNWFLNYFSEFKAHWRPFLACFIGLGTALSINSSLLSIMAPYYRKYFDWSVPVWADIQSASIVILFCLPFVGGLVDRFGVRKIAPIGMVAFPLSLFAIAALTPSPDSVRNYTLIFVAQTVLACTTTATVYTRLVAGSFVKSRGLALGLCALSPAIFGFFAPPIISSYVKAHDWQTGLTAIAIFSVIGSLVTFALLPKQQATMATQKKDSIWRSIIARPVFWTIFVATFLVSMPHCIVLAQLKEVTIAQGMTDAQAAILMTIFSGAVITGRILSGFALDKFKPHSVAALFLGLPVIGLMLFVSQFDGFEALAVAIMFVGFAFGGEGDIVGFLIMRHFGIGVFSTVMGLTTAAIGLASSMGSKILGSLHKATGDFNAYLIFAAACVFLGALLFKFLERFPQDAPEGESH